MGDAESNANGESSGAPVVVGTYDNAISAHSAASKLESEGIAAHVWDEHLLTMDPLLHVAVGGIKVVVASVDAAAARAILGRKAPAEEQLCPQCDSSKLTTHRAGRRSAFLAILLLGIPIGRSGARIRCGDCGHTWRE